MLRCNVSDLFSLSKREISPEGYLLAPANMSAAGNVQGYAARELGLDGDPNRIIKLYRPPEEVFASEAIASFEQKPVTNDHPPAGVEVTADNWDKYSVGDVHGIGKGSGFMTGRVIVRDKSSIADVMQDGKKAMSCGYSFDLDMTPGTSPGGEKYDGIQRTIRGNHLAIVDSARGGPSCRIADSNRTKEHIMRVRVLDATVGNRTIPGYSFTVSDEAAGFAAQDAADKHQRALVDCMTAHDAVVQELNAFKAKAKEDELTGAAKTEEATKTADALTKELAATKALVPTLEQLDAAVAERTKLAADARSIMGETFEIAGKTNAAIRTEVLTAIVAADGARKTVAVAALAGVEPAKADAAASKLAFDVAISVAPAVTTGDSVRAADAQARAFAPHVTRGATFAADAKEWTGEQIFAYRQTHQGKNPPGFDAAKA